uniref:MIF4G domain-containing protein n=1 Tax=Rhabditophanes sp. KR3021 TaxID=114890 RepID=A0AC35TGE3_9BILA
MVKEGSSNSAASRQAGEDSRRRLCKWRTEYRNTNGAESFNPKLRGLPSSKKHGSIRNTIETILGVDGEERGRIALIGSSNSKFYLAKSHKKDLAREEMIREAQDVFENGNFRNVEKYLASIIKTLLPYKFEKLFIEISDKIVSTGLTDVNDERAIQDVINIYSHSDYIARFSY